MTKFLTATGYASEIVEVSYEYDDDSNTVDFEVTWNGREVSGLLSDDQRDTIESECHANERKLTLIDSVNAANDKLANLFSREAA